MTTRLTSYFLALLTALALVAPLSGAGASSSDTKPATGSTPAGTKAAAKPAQKPAPKGVHASSSSAHKPKGNGARSTSSAKVASANSPAKTKGAAIAATSKHRRIAVSAPGHARGGTAHKGRVSRSHLVAKGRGASAGHRLAKAGSGAKSHKAALAMTPATSPRPPFVHLPVIDLSTSEAAPEGRPLVRSGSALVVDAAGEEIYAKNPDVMLPIASITKLMTAMVVLDSGAPLDESITIREEDRDWLRGSRSRLQDGRATLMRRELLQLALMSSENRAAAALARTTFPGGTQEFVASMNRKAESLGMTRSHFADGTGLDGHNTSTARDLVRMLRAAYEYPEIRQATTTESAEVQPYGEFRSLSYRNTNRLMRTGDWQIDLSKTGYLNEAGRCLAMRTRIEDRPLYMVFLNAPGKLTPFEDSNRLRRWLESRS